jgi:putative membrane protein
MAEALAAYLHYLSIFALFALLTFEHGLFKLPLDLPRARRLLRIDAAYGATAVLVLASGAVRAIWFAKGLDYYLHNGLFHAKVGLFVLVGLLSIVPTRMFLGWRGALKAGQLPSIDAARAKRVILVIRLELLLLLLIPLLAALMARGFGVFG